MRTLELGVVPPRGVLPTRMKAMVIRPDRQGDPSSAMQLEEIEVPEVGPDEVLVLVMAAGVNFNGVWAARGAPVSVFDVHRQPLHIAGSDASGLVWKVGENVRRWRVGDEVIVHCNQSCGECPACNGFDPMACEQQRIWGYETPYGSFAQLTVVQSQQLLPKPTHLSWQEAASYGLTLFTAYRMLVHQAQVGPGDHVLVWGGAGGLGIFAVQLCRLLGAHAIAVVSSPEKGELALQLGAKGYVDRRKFRLQAEGPEQLAELRRFGREIRAITGGVDADVVFEHVGQETLGASVYLARRFGKIVLCGATSGHQLTFDARHLWMRQKSILGSHFCNAYQASRANQLVIEGRIKPVVTRVFPLEQTALAHALMADNSHTGKFVIEIQAPPLARLARWPASEVSCSQ